MHYDPETVLQGSFKGLALAEVPEAALQCRKLWAQGFDPIREKKRQRIAAQLKDAIKAHASEWKENHQKDKWE